MYVRGAGMRTDGRMKCWYAYRWTDECIYTGEVGCLAVLLPPPCRQYPVGVLYDMMVLSGETPWKIWVRYQVSNAKSSSSSPY